MSVWEKYSKNQQEKYIKYLQVFGSLTNLFRQKATNSIPYLDSKYQETIFAKSFDAKNVDFGNTPHDILSIFGKKRVGIGLKTWMGSEPSFQKVMQLKRFKNEIALHAKKQEDLAYKISEIRNERVSRDYKRLGLSKENNIYHYVTRDKGSFTINECAYPLIDLNNLNNFNFNSDKKILLWSDGYKDYKYTFSDSQIWQRFDANKYKTLLLKRFNVAIIEDPFSILLEIFGDRSYKPSNFDRDKIEVYLPLYSFNDQQVQKKSGLNAWNAAPKTKNSSKPRPLHEIYIPIPREFHRKQPDFFTENIFEFEKEQKNFSGDKKDKPEIRFYLNLPNGMRIPALVTQSSMKALQSGSNTEYDENGKLFGQSALGKWLLLDVLGLGKRELVTLDWLHKRGTDCVRIWRKKDDYKDFYIDFAPMGAFESFIKNKVIDRDEEEL